MGGGARSRSLSQRTLASSAVTDSRSDQASPSDYPWYRSVADGSIEQGDLLLNFPSVTVDSSYGDLLQQSVEADIVWNDVIVLTQSCDLLAGKVARAVLCPFFAKEELVAEFKDSTSRGWEKQILQGRVESLYLLPPCQVGGIDLERRIVNFRQILAVPLDHVAEHAQRQERRARLSPPYREHLAQAFARFIMRIGFPIDFRL